MASFMRQFEKKKTIAKRSKKHLEEALYKRLFKEGSSELAVRQQLNQFLKSRKRVFKWEVDHSLKTLRSRDRFHPALKLSESMEHRGFNKTVGDKAVHLDLLAKVRGLAAAETYFMNLSEKSKNLMTYGALLNCYCKELKTEKAEALLEKMKELKLGLTAMSYNSLMTLYSKTNQSERIPSIIQEMKASGIKPDSFTYNVWMRALASDNDISGVERVIDEMKNNNGGVSADWTTYSNLASIYVNAGLNDKAEQALKELEEKNERKDLSAYQYLITLYGRTGNLPEVRRVWLSLKSAFKKTANISYLNMIQVMVKLNDVPGAEECFKEWESGCPTYDIRVSNVLVGAYLRDGLIDEAEKIVHRARSKGTKPNAKTYEIFLDYHLKNGEIDKAVDCVGKAISIGKGDGTKWVPSSETTDSLMQHFEQNKDVDGAEGYLAVLGKAVDELGAKVFESLIRTYAAAGRTSPMIRRRIKMENTEVGEECTKLLDAVSAV